MKLYYDFHLHSCLSPCGDNDMTPYNLVNLAKLFDYDIIALTDHNSCKNCESAIKIGEKIGLGADYAREQLEREVLTPYRKYIEELKEQMAADDEKIWTKAKAKIATLLYWPRLELTTLARDYQYAMADMDEDATISKTLRWLIE